MPGSWRTERARVANAVRNGNPLREAEARARLKEVRAEDYIRKLVDSAPVLAPDARERLAGLLRGTAPPGLIATTDERRSSQAATRDRRGAAR